MFGMVNVLGHLAELHYERHLIKQNIPFEKAETDEYYDYMVQGQRVQVKRWSTDHTDQNTLGANLTKTHGNRKGPDGFYKRDDFDILIIYDAGFGNFIKINNVDIPSHKKHGDRLPAIFKVSRNIKIIDDDLAFLNALKAKNELFPPAIEKLRESYSYTYVKMLEKISKLSLDDIYSVFNDSNFRLIIGAKGFVAEEHFNMWLEKHKIPYKQSEEMYSKADHIINGKKIQVKTPLKQATNKTEVSFKTHKTHGHDIDELYRADDFDIVALFLGYEYDEIDRYMPSRTHTEFALISIDDIPRHHEHTTHLKRVTRKSRANLNTADISLLT